MTDSASSRRSRSTDDDDDFTSRSLENTCSRNLRVRKRDTRGGMARP